jgi:rubrerythrin
MSTMQNVQTFDPITLLRSLAELDYDMVEAYETAIARLDDRALAERMAGFLEDHRTHVVDLNVHIVDLGGRAWVEEDVRHVLAEGKVFLASALGDRGIVRAMLSNEKEANGAYVRAAATPGLATRIREMLDSILEEELEHRSWMRQTLQALGG